MKKLISLIIATVLLFNIMTAFANQYVNEETLINPEEIYYEEYTGPTETYRFVSDTTEVDGKEYNARQLVAGYEYAHSGTLYIEIAPLARGLGYNVSYMEETDSVVFEKDGNKREFFFSKDEIVENGDHENSVYVDVLLHEDRTYVGYPYIDRVLDGVYPNVYTWDYSEENSYTLYSAENLINKYKESFNGLDKMVEIFASNTCTSNSDTEVVFDFSIKDLGINFNGGCKISENSLFDKGKICMDLSLEGEGIVNLLKMLLKLTEDDEAEINFDEVIETSVIIDDAVYVKGDFNELAVKSDIPYFVDEDYELDPELEKLIEGASNGWIKIGLDTFNETLPQNAEALITDIAYDDYMSYEDKRMVLDFLSGIINAVTYSVKETDDGYISKINLDKTAVDTLLTLADIELPDELKGISLDEFNVASESIIKKDGSGFSKTDVKFALSEIIPLNSKTKIGELSVTVKSEGETKTSNEKVTVPEEYVDYEVLEEKLNALYNEYYMN